jgi:hypothetical protein
MSAKDPDQASNDYDRLMAVLGPRFDELRSFADDFTSRWRGDALRAGETSRRRVQEIARDLGLVTRDEWDELELRVAQLEHRLHLLEDEPGPRTPDRP